ncbi:hypothetical protein LCGC14_1085440 [marine sediment metagenome]|uniref:Uncharacterized protein n=1 Tax=marine sediment metagenome TaxID=412755 RepID=A0A0F9N1J2_9ZZZZ
MEAVTRDPISLALAKRRERVLASEASKEHLDRLLASNVSLDTGFLVGLLSATWERLPDMHLVGWESPTAKPGDDTLAEVIAIGEKVGNVLTVYSTVLDEASLALEKKS